MTARARVRGRHAAAALMKTLLWAMAFATAASAAEPPSEQSVPSARAVHSLLIDAVHAGDRLVVVGDRGHILLSDDQGATWRQAQVPSRQLLTAVYFVDAQHGWAVGHDAQILASRDGGATWSKQFEDLAREAPLLDVYFLDTQRGFAVGAYGALLHTEDGGQQWTRLQSPYDGSLFGVLGTATPGTVLVYGLRGNLLRSDDFGDRWHTVELPTARGPLAFGLAGGALLGDGSVVVVGNGGSVLRSRDDGRHFSVHNRPDRQALSAVAGRAGGLLLVGQGGVRLTDADGADQEVQP